MAASVPYRLPPSATHGDGCLRGPCQCPPSVTHSHGRLWESSQCLSSGTHSHGHLRVPCQCPPSAKAMAASDHPAMSSLSDTWPWVPCSDLPGSPLRDTQPWPLLGTLTCPPLSNPKPWLPHSAVPRCPSATHSNGHLGATRHVPPQHHVLLSDFASLQRCKLSDEPSVCLQHRQK